VFVLEVKPRLLEQDLVVVDLADHLAVADQVEDVELAAPQLPYHLVERVGPPDDLDLGRPCGGEMAPGAVDLGLHVDGGEPVLFQVGRIRHRHQNLEPLSLAAELHRPPVEAAEEPREVDPLVQ
jgi:hypothetical protein